MRRIHTSALNFAALSARAVEGKFCGFMVGPGSDHDIMRVVTDRGTWDAEFGAVYPVACTKVEIQAIRWPAYEEEGVHNPDETGLDHTPIPLFAELWLFECPSEMAAAANNRRRSPRLFQLSTVADIEDDTDQFSWSIPVAGRNAFHYSIRAAASVADAGTLKIYGARPSLGESELVLIDTVAVPGTQESDDATGLVLIDERYDHLLFWVQSESEITTSFSLCGEAHDA